MYYYYDILLNFGSDSELYEFYEWEENDYLEYVKKIPVFRVNNKTIKDCLESRIEFKNDFVNLIEGKTILKKKDSDNLRMCLLSDSNHAIGIELDKTGKVVSRSKMLLEDEINLNDVLFTMKETTLEYNILEKWSVNKSLRQVDKIKKVVQCEIDTLYETNNISKLKYLYYELFNKNSDSLDTLHDDIENYLHNVYNDNLQEIYDLIKLSYKVN